MAINLSTFLGTTFQGNTGVQGVQGLSNQGTIGSQGVQGLSNQGVQGSIGIQGNLGSQGAQGTQGSLLTSLPQSTNTTIVSSDSGKHLNIDANVTINGSTGFTVGSMCTIYNSGITTRSITPSGVTLRFAGTSSTGTRFIREKGLANILCVASNDYVISGAGLT